MDVLDPVLDLARMGLENVGELAFQLPEQGQEAAERVGIVLEDLLILVDGLERLRIVLFHIPQEGAYEVKVPGRQFAVNLSADILGDGAREGVFDLLGQPAQGSNLILGCANRGCREKIISTLCELTVEELENAILFGCILLAISMEVKYSPGKCLPCKCDYAANNGSYDPFFHVR